MRGMIRKVSHLVRIVEDAASRLRKLAGMQLNEIRDNAGARSREAARPRHRLRQGQDFGRGHKGQKARSGVAINGFEGGQMPIHMRLPKRGFNNPSSEVLGSQSGRRTGCDRHRQARR